MKKVITIFVFLSYNTLLSQNTSVLSRAEEDRRANTPVPFTLADRDRILKLDVKTDELKHDIENLRQENKKDIENLRQENKKDIENLRQEMLLRFEAQQQQINDIKNWLYVILAIIIGQFAYIIWDRRTFMKPLETEVYKLKAEYELQKNLDNDHKQLSNKLLEVLKELATHNEEIRKVLQKFHLL